MAVTTRSPGAAQILEHLVHGGVADQFDGSSRSRSSRVQRPGTGTGSIGYAPTLSEALAQVFTVPGSPPPPPGSTGGGTGPPSPGGTANSTVLKYLQQAENFYNQAQTALKNGDLGTYQADLAKVKAALDKAQQAAAGGSAAKPKAGATPQPSPSKSG